MVTLTTEVLVIGGGATGAGVAWDASLRGLDVILVDRLDLAEGTSGRFHGLLHSGGTLRGQGPARRARVHRREPHPAPVAADCIEDTGGLFVTTPWDDPAYADRFVAGLRATPTSTARRSRSARRSRARAAPATRRSLGRSGCPTPTSTSGRPSGRWRTAPSSAAPGSCPTTRSRPSGATATRSPARSCVTCVPASELEIEARVTVNATGAWAGRIADAGRDRGRPRASRAAGS